MQQAICYSDKKFVNSSPKNQHFIWEQKEKSVRNFRTFTVVIFQAKLNAFPHFIGKEIISLSWPYKFSSGGELVGKELNPC